MSQPTPAQLAAIQQRVAAEAEKRGISPQQLQAQMQQQALVGEAQKRGISPQQLVEEMKAQIIQQHQQQQQEQQQQEQGDGEGGGGDPQVQQPEGQKIAVNPNNPPDARAIAVAQFLKAQELKPRACILDGQRKELFKVKRAKRALTSESYKKACVKNPLLPPVKNDTDADNVFKLLPLSFLALRVSKTGSVKQPTEPGAAGGSSGGKSKRVKGYWTVQVEPQQVTEPMMHYVWLYEGPQWKQKAYAAGVLVAIMAVVMFPLWPMVLRQGVWYLSMGMLGLLGLFFLTAIFRLILFCVTVLAVPPGLWLYPNLFADVGFFDSFRPVWAWAETKSKKKKRSKTQTTAGNGDKKPSQAAPTTPAAAGAGAGTATSSKGGGVSATSSATAPAPAPSKATGAAAPATTPTSTTASATTKRNLAASVEEIDED